MLLQLVVVVVVAAYLMLLLRTVDRVDLAEAPYKLVSAVLEHLDKEATAVQEIQIAQTGVAVVVVVPEVLVVMAHQP